MSSAEKAGTGRRYQPCWSGLPPYLLSSTCYIRPAPHRALLSNDAQCETVSDMRSKLDMCSRFDTILLGVQASFVVNVVSPVRSFLQPRSLLTTCHNQYRYREVSGLSWRVSSRVLLSLEVRPSFCSCASPLPAGPLTAMTSSRRFATRLSCFKTATVACDADSIILGALSSAGI